MSPPALCEGLARAQCKQGQSSEPSAVSSNQYSIVLSLKLDNACSRESQRGMFGEAATSNNGNYRLLDVATPWEIMIKPNSSMTCFSMIHKGKTYICWAELKRCSWEMLQTYKHAWCFVTPKHLALVYYYYKFISILTSVKRQEAVFKAIINDRAALVLLSM